MSNLISDINGRTDITVEQLKALLGSDMQLIDLREEWEQPRVDELEADIIPYPHLEQYIDRIDRQRPVVMFCQVGVRSRKAIKHLKKKYGFDNLINLTGGIINWSRD